MLPDLNHLLARDTDGFPGKYKQLPPPVMIQEEALEPITTWLAERLK